MEQKRLVPREEGQQIARPALVGRRNEPEDDQPADGAIRIALVGIRARESDVRFFNGVYGATQFQNRPLNVRKLDARHSEGRAASDAAAQKL
jgi:hypothetical protein